MEKLEALGADVDIDQANWSQYPYQPQVRLWTGYQGRHLYLLYKVTEKDLRLVNTEDNQPVYQDSCVEAFLMPQGGDYYRNFEFNAMGVCLAGEGPKGEDRVLLEPAKLDKIVRFSSLVSPPEGEEKGPFEWFLYLEIPLGEFWDVQDLSDIPWKGNFYKCGDKTKEPHYVSWAPIFTEVPSFHQPKFFANIRFINKNIDS